MIYRTIEEVAAVLDWTDIYNGSITLVVVRRGGRAARYTLPDTVRWYTGMLYSFLLDCRAAIPHSQGLPTDVMDQAMCRVNTDRVPVLWFRMDEILGIRWWELEGHKLRKVVDSVYMGRTDDLRGDTMTETFFLFWP